jgi:transposase-like protein
LLAVHAIQKRKIKPILEIARRFDVPKSTLRMRLHGTTNRAGSRADSHKLTQIEEDLLKQRMLS